MKMTKEEKPRGKRRGVLLGLIAAALTVAILLSALVLALTASPVAYTYGGASLREDAFSYWFSCLKYEYLVHYRDLVIEDSAEGWAKTDDNGVSYNESFSEMIRDEILLRFAAASLFDSQGYTLSKADYNALEELILEFEAESFGEVGFRVLKETYGVKKSTVKQVALYEKKYAALYTALFSDVSAVYTAQYRASLEEFYEKYYARYNMIYIGDAIGEERIETLENALFGGLAEDKTVGTGVSEETFTSLEADYSEPGQGITSAKHPNGIYLYAYENYAGAFSDELLSAFRLADEAGKVVKVRDAANKGSYYVMRYALDKEPYLSDDSLVLASFADLPTYASTYLYRALLEEELADIVSCGIADGYRVADVFTCKDYNVVRWAS